MLEIDRSFEVLSVRYGNPLVGKSLTGQPHIKVDRARRRSFYDPYVMIDTISTGRRPLVRPIDEHAIRRLRVGDDAAVRIAPRGCGAPERVGPKSPPGALNFGGHSIDQIRDRVPVVDAATTAGPLAGPFPAFECVEHGLPCRACEHLLDGLA